MTDIRIKEFIIQALEKLLQTDCWLLKNDLSEQCISHRIAFHLDSLFEDYNVDCEYNRDVDSLNEIKAIKILKDTLEQIGLLHAKEKSNLDEELTDRAVFPDIIIHRRGSNNHNLCVIEVKKSSSKVSFDYDNIKLESYTSGNNGNHLKYKLGVFILLIIDKDNPSFEVKFYKNGTEFIFEDDSQVSIKKLIIDDKEDYLQ